MNLSSADLAQLRSKSITVQQVDDQLDAFVSGFPYLSISCAAVVGHGIVSIDRPTVDKLARMWDQSVVGQGLTVEKFVPASGAASRMFKEYFDFLTTGRLSQSVGRAVENIDKFAFVEDLEAMGVDKQNATEVVRAIITGLDYGAKPKALLKFHRYADGGRTACEEHLVEGALYGVSADGKVRIHFTVSPEHKDEFERVVALHKSKLEGRYGVTLLVSYSQQKSSTDTVAVDLDNEPFRDGDNKLLFRPAGHGALIENLNDIRADVIFIKTVDNLVPDSGKADTVLYKKALACYGLQLQNQIFEYLRALDSNRADRGEIVDFFERNIGYKFATDTVSTQQLHEILNRPLRICGMVRNEGEPGGGPFWVFEPDGAQSIQIVEGSQISPLQQDLVGQATHFNPVDLVCFTRTYKNERFDLTQYTDPSTGFISQKSYGGRELKAQELPGLWNGAMARFNTVFVEVPLTTFAPVKVLSDLLRIEHLG